MAIHCMNPNTIGTETEDLVSYIISESGGKGVLTKFENSISNLRNHWTGSDAYNQLNGLIGVYNSTRDLLKKVQDYLVVVNNEQIIPLQKDIVNDGGECTIGSELYITEIGTDVNPVPFIVETRTEDAMIQDAEYFANIPADFQTFVTTINSKKETLLNNWLDGAGRENVVTSFKNFNEDVETHGTTLTTVKSKLDTIASNKQKLMN